MSEHLELAAQIEDGIYFGLPMEVYLLTPRLGASDLADLNASPADFWNGSWLDPDRDVADDDDEDAEKKAKHLIIGEAYHCARLEPDEFFNRFARQPCKADYAEQAKSVGACWNGREIEAQLEGYGLPKKSKDDTDGVASQARRLRDAGYEGVIWPLVMSDFAFECGTRQPIEAKVWDEITRDMERLKGAPEIADKLTGGAAEVSVFWTDKNNIQRKARFDYLKVELWSEMKTFDNSRRKRLDQAIADAVRFYRYYLTAASYREASEAIRTGGLQIKSGATDQQREMIAKIQISTVEQECWFIFQQKGGAPNVLARKFEFFDVPAAIENSWDTGADEEAVQRGHDATRRPTQIYQKGIAEIDYAKRMFVMYSQIYRPGQPWAPYEPLGVISDTAFNPNWLEGRYE
jgi:hypothetical protein